MSIISLRQVSVTYLGSDVPAVKGANLDVGPGERVGIVGESGSGKSTLAAAILRSLPSGATVDGDITYKGESLRARSTAAFRELRSVELAHIPQDPLASLNPVLRISKQMRDVIQAHRKVNRHQANREVEEALAEVGIPEPHVKRKNFPHELSGGMRQRVLIAMSLINQPHLLIADEPTTALDVTVQAQIIELLHHQLASRDMTLLLITHDIGVVAELCSYIVVMRHGEILEQGPLETLSTNPTHPYTKQLFDAAHMDYVTEDVA